MVSLNTVGLRIVSGSSSSLDVKPSHGLAKDLRDKSRPIIAMTDARKSVGRNVMVNHAVDSCLGSLIPNGISFEPAGEVVHDSKKILVTLSGCLKRTDIVA